MGIRWIMHKADGKTITSNWDSNDVSFRKNWSDDITSLQLQMTYKNKLYTLSARKNSKTVFWQTDDFLFDPNNSCATMVARKIFKKLSKDIWLELSLKEEGNLKPVINIIKKEIKIK
jgi:hypothetical protein